MRYIGTPFARCIPQVYRLICLFLFLCARTKFFSYSTLKHYNNEVNIWFYSWFSLIFTVINIIIRCTWYACVMYIFTDDCVSVFVCYVQKKQKKNWETEWWEQALMWIFIISLKIRFYLKFNDFYLSENMLVFHVHDPNIPHAALSSWWANITHGMYGHCHSMKFMQNSTETTLNNFIVCRTNRIALILFRFLSFVPLFQLSTSRYFHRNTFYN